MIEHNSASVPTVWAINEIFEAGTKKLVESGIGVLACFRAVTRFFVLGARVTNPDRIFTANDTWVG